MLPYVAPIGNAPERLRFGGPGGEGRWPNNNSRAAEACVGCWVGPRSSQR